MLRLTARVLILWSLLSPSGLAWGAVAQGVALQESGHSLVWQKQAGQGSYEEKLALVDIQAGGDVTLDGEAGVLAQIPEGDLKQSLASLSAQPGQAWIAALATRDDVDWQKVALAHEHWDYEAEGLTPAGAAMIAIAVATATYGAGSALVGTTTTAASGATTTAVAGITLSTTTAATATTAAAATYTTAGMMINAGWTTLATQASVSLINNKGDIGATLKELGSQESVKQVILSAIVAGVAAETSSWGRTLTKNDNWIVTDGAKRVAAVGADVGAKAALYGAEKREDWVRLLGSRLATEVYQSNVGHDADPRPGVDRKGKLAPRFVPLKGADQGRVPRELVKGFWRDGKNIGWNFFGKECKWTICQGDGISNALNQIPGLNAFATLHDTWMTPFGDDLNPLLNIGTMIPALGVTYGTLYDRFGQNYENARKQDE